MKIAFKVFSTFDETFKNTFNVLLKVDQWSNYFEINVSKFYQTLQKMFLSNFEGYFKL